jgi:hypothetical protein
MATRQEPTAEYFDGWYADMVGSPAKDEIVQRHLGLPPHLLSTSLLGWEGMAEIVEALRLSAGRRFQDLACGRGFPGADGGRPPTHGVLDEADPVASIVGLGQ